MRMFETNNDKGAPQQVEYRRLIESLRVTLAIIAGLLMIDAPSGSPPSLLWAVMSFSAYAVLLLCLAAKGVTQVQQRFIYWIDAAWFLGLLVLAEGARTHFFYFLFFPVFFSAWRTGYRESVLVAVVSSFASLWVFIIFEPQLAWLQLLTLPLSLLIVAPMFVALARTEVLTHKNQLFASAFIGALDPRRGFEGIVTDLMKKLAQHIHASAALFVLKSHEGRRIVFCWENDEEVFQLSETQADPIIETVLALPADVFGGWANGRCFWGRAGKSFDDQTPIKPTAEERSMMRSVTHLLGRDRLVTLPLESSGIGQMRLLFGGNDMHVNQALIRMLWMIVERVHHSLENAYLRELLATEAADTERARIGRDLHDSAVQPYIGLKFALEALRRKAGDQNPVSEDIDRIVEMANEELASMREVISGLRATPGSGGALLSAAVRRQAARFSQLFGIEVHVEVDGEMPVSRRMAGALFHIVAEGLSNIRRHTQAREAWIKLLIVGGELIIRIRNENDAGLPANFKFTPRSLTERAFDLGGGVEMENDGISTTVVVRVPLPSR